MTDSWYTEPGATGTAKIKSKGGSWYVSEPHVRGETKCMANVTAESDSNGTTVTITGTVSKFMRGDGDSTNYLYLSDCKIVSAANETGRDRSATSSDGGSADKSADLVTDSTRTSTKSSRTTRTSRSSSSKSRSRSKSNDSLDKIAEEKIGDEDLTIEQGDDDESIIGEAKKRAKDQGRDPAIDPDLQGGS